MKSKNKLPMILTVCALMPCQISPVTAFMVFCPAVASCLAYIISSRPLNLLAQHCSSLVYWSTIKSFHLAYFTQIFVASFLVPATVVFFFSYRNRGKKPSIVFFHVKEGGDGWEDFIPRNPRYCFLNIVFDMKQLYNSKTIHESKALYPSSFLWFCYSSAK